MQRGEVLVEQGDRNVPFFVVVSGEVEIVRPSGGVETLITIHGPGQFSGEVNMLSGRPTVVRMRATKPGELIELDRQHMLSLPQTDADLGEILMRAFILRRLSWWRPAWEMLCSSGQCTPLVPFGSKSS